MDRKKLRILPAAAIAAKLILDPAAASTPPLPNALETPLGNESYADKSPLAGEWINILAEFGITRRHFNEETRVAHELVAHRIELEEKRKPNKTRAEYIREIINQENKTLKPAALERQKEIIAFLQEITEDMRRISATLGNDNLRLKLMDSAELRSQVDSWTKKVKVLYAYPPYQSLKKYEFNEISRAYQRWILEHELLQATPAQK